ncbi:hypothetical protein [Streptomyces buecherae]|uniref:Nuclear transport factor 2 family protein n=1 Tax=Streptomyces buecherae TaxID=2763006 RepID=A0A7H8N6F1_9ACTN|nr:hypothetical protein [Streptomyces buecherae]QKW49992.1 hypothetical protein HUT08_11045 [Streptomyces buecherae]
MRRCSARSTASALGVLIAVGLTAGCEWTETTPESSSRIQEVLPADPDEARSEEHARDFRAWVDDNGTPRQREAVTRVLSIIGEWDEETGNAYVSTDINGGLTPVEDSMASATALAEAFDRWQNSEQGFVSVYDVAGNALIANYEF